MSADNSNYLYDFIVYLEEKIKEEGILGDYYSDNERESDVLEMIWDAYIKFKENS